METNRISALRNVVNADPRAGDASEASQGDASRSIDPIDFAFLAAQTFADRGLEREVLILFATQARRVVPTLPELTPCAQGEAAHLLKGSARGIGAWAAAAAAESYERADAPTRAALQAEVAFAFAAAEAAIAAHLGEAGTSGTSVA